MTAPVAVLAVLLLLALLGQVRVGVRGEYGPAGPGAWLRLGPVRLTLWPRGGKTPKKRAGPRRTEGAKRPGGETRRRQDRPAGAGEAPRSARASRERRRRESPEGARSLREGLDYVSALLPTALEAAGQFRRKLRVDELFLEVRVAGADPAAAASAYGSASAALGALWGPLNEAFRIEDGTIRVLPDLEGSRSGLEGRVSLSLTLAQLLRLGSYFGYKGLRAFLTVKGAHDRARQRKAV